MANPEYPLTQLRNRAVQRIMSLNGDGSGTQDMLLDYSAGGGAEGNFYWAAAKDGEILELKQLLYRISCSAGTQADIDGFGSQAKLGVALGSGMKIKRKGVPITVFSQLGVDPAADQLLADCTADFGTTLRRNTDALRWGGEIHLLAAADWGGTLGDQVFGIIDLEKVFGQPMILNGTLGDYFVVLPLGDLSSQGIVGHSVAVTGIAKNASGWETPAT
jgi:hypothetical protein